MTRFWQCRTTEESHRPKRRGPRRFLQFGMRGILLLTLLASIAAWWYARPEQIEELSADGSLRTVREVYRDEEELPVNHGWWTTYDEQGRKRIEGRYRRGQPTGLWKYWREDGSLLMQGRCQDGEREGAWQAWHGEAAKKEEIAFQQGLAKGPYRAWRSDGKLREQGQMIQGGRHGDWTFHDQQGRVCRQGAYAQGRRQGAWRQFDTEGQHSHTVSYQNDRPLGDVKQTVAAWGKRLLGNDHSRRDEAAWALPLLGTPALPTLIEAAQSPQEHIRLLAIAALAELGPDAAPAVSNIVAALDGRPRLQGAAVVALGKIGPHAASALPRLEELARNKPLLQSQAWASILGIDSSREDVAQRLIKQCVGERYLQVLEQGILFRGTFLIEDLDLPQLPPAATSALAALLNHDNIHLRAGTALALGTIGPPETEAVRALITVLDDDSSEVRRCALNSLAHFGPRAKAALPKVELLSLQDPEPEVRDEAESVTAIIRDDPVPFWGFGSIF